MDGVLRGAGELPREGLADQPPADERGWRRGLLLSCNHAVDLAVVVDALGHPLAPEELGRHDQVEPVAARWLKTRVHSAAPWDRRFVGERAAGEPGNIGLLN